MPLDRAETYRYLLSILYSALAHSYPQLLKFLLAIARFQITLWQPCGECLLPLPRPYRKKKKEKRIARKVRKATEWSRMTVPVVSDALFSAVERSFCEIVKPKPSDCHVSLP
ncbi:hypothetical protein NPIL_442571 [Nephila pilipes]|uniref:Uncharacterized protein n=1 Tax=Nephila pilipes TaxID=299642 RepID=A0A8X6I7H3_NEPPI|nr:hypothetical protein NPIL_442571 [Nephila pilipes]